MAKALRHLKFDPVMEPDATFYSSLDPCELIKKGLKGDHIY